MRFTVALTIISPYTITHYILTANIYIRYYFHFHPQLSPLYIHTLLSHLTLTSNIVSSCTPTHYYFRYHLYPPLCPLTHLLWDRKWRRYKASLNPLSQGSTSLAQKVRALAGSRQRICRGISGPRATTHPHIILFPLKRAQYTIVSPYPPTHSYFR